jgi:hypothetical protein
MEYIDVATSMDGRAISQRNVVLSDIPPYPTIYLNNPAIMIKIREFN